MIRIALYDPYLEAFGGGEKYLLRLGEALARHPGAHVTLLAHENHLRPGVLDELRAYFALELRGFELQALEPVPTSLPAYLRFWARTRRFDLLVCLANGIPKWSGARRSVAIVQFPHAPAHARDLGPWQRFVLSGYECVVYSAFVREWLERRWGRSAMILAPPIAAAAFEASEPFEPSGPLARLRRIVSVGRFFRGGHEKKHAEMMQMFERLRAGGGFDEWELHLAGTVADKDRAWFDTLAARAAPGVTLHPNAPAGEIRALYAASTLYWHAAGADVDEALHPEQLEHFGMTTAEAMAYGCVPVVIGKGGQKEILEQGVQGWLCRDLSEMETRTREVLRDPSGLVRMSAAARARAALWSDEAFLRAVQAAGWLGSR